MDLNSNIEAEIAALSAKIAEKRRELEASKGMVAERPLDGGEDRSSDVAENRELVRSVVGEKIASSVPQAQPTGQTPQTSSAPASSAGKQPLVSKASYLDSLDEESRAQVQELVESVFTSGLEKTLKSLEFEEPFIIDAFHDVLTDKIYGELKKRGMI